MTYWEFGGKCNWVTTTYVKGLAGIKEHLKDKIKETIVDAAEQVVAKVEDKPKVETDAK